MSWTDSHPAMEVATKLKEASDSYRPMSISTSSSSSSSNSSSIEVKPDVLSFTTQRKKVEKKAEAPSTPGRPVFSFSVAKKGFPSKWDDAQKWLSNGSNESPAHHPIKSPALNSASHSASAGSEAARVLVQGDGFGFRQQMDEFAEKFRVGDQKLWSFTDSVAFELRQRQQQKLNPTRSHGGVSPPVDVLLKDKFTEEVESVCTETKYSEKEAFMFRNSAKEAILEVQHRDIGTEMTPLGSSTTSRSPTPFKPSSPARHNTPADRSGPLAVSDTTSIDIMQLQKCHLAKLQLGAQYESVASNWSSRQEEEEEVSKSLRHFDSGFRRSYSETRTAAWEEEEKTKCCLRYQREEAKIQAWVNLQSAKAEAQSRKLEVKIERMRSSLEEKLMKRMAGVHRKAEEWRAAAQLQHSVQIKKSSDQARKFLSRHPHFSTQKSSCGCFPCSNSNLSL
uniref:Remorin C-terminal domain-containing protein n=1 Tax=Kalanchoe fedtschenkoi TaxID=63787 RepID=A0A7N0RGS0_KALFE